MAMEDVNGNTTIAAIMVCLSCHEEGNWWSKTQMGRISFVGNNARAAPGSIHIGARAEKRSLVHLTVEFICILLTDIRFVIMYFSYIKYIKL